MAAYAMCSRESAYSITANPEPADQPNANTTGRLGPKASCIRSHFFRGPGTVVCTSLPYPTQTSLALSLTSSSLSSSHARLQKLF